MSEHLSHLDTDLVDFPHDAELVQPLMPGFNWNSQCQAAFDSLTKALVSDSIVRFPHVDFAKHTRNMLSSIQQC